MAGNDTAALVVALSAQITKFEKDMKGAVDIAAKHTKQIETRFGAMNKEINSQFSNLAAGYAGNLGALGSIIRTLGPAGLIAAAGIGAAVAVVWSFVNAAGEFAERAKRLKEGAETIGLTINQLRLLGQAGSRVGLDFDESTSFFTQFIVRLQALREGSGPLFNALLKIDVELLRQLSVTTDSAAAIDILVRAYGRLTDAGKRLELSKAAGGRGGLSGGRALEDLGNRGGLSGLEANSPRIDEGQITRAAQLKVEIDAIARRTQNIWAGMFSDTILEHQKAARLEMQQLALWVERVAKADWTGQLIAAARTLAGIRDKEGEAGGRDRVTRLTVNPAAPPPGAVSPAVELAILQKNISLLGDAVTQGELWRQKRLQIAAAVAEGGIQDGVAGRALAAFNITMRAAALATLERLGVAREQEIVDVKLAQLAQDRIKFGLTENQVQQATVVILREAKQAAEALEVRRAYLPGLKQLELDAQNVRKNLDTLGVNSLNSLTDAMVDAATGTKTMAAAFSDMAKSIIRDLIKIAIQKNITGPLAGSLGGLFSGPKELIFAPGNAAGTSNWPGGWSWVGERGPELINLPRGAQVIPNDVATRGGGSVIVGDTNLTIMGNADDHTISQIQNELAAHRRAIVQQTKGMRSAGYGQRTGVGLSS